MSGESAQTKPPRHPALSGFVKTPEGVAIAYDSVGEGPAVFLLHGGGQTRHSWSKTAQILAGLGYRAICLDARGHGQSDWTEYYSLPLFAQDIGAAISELADGEAPAIIGASLGGLSAVVALAGDDPAPSSALVLVDIATKVKHKGASQIRDFMAANKDGFASVEEAADAVSRYMTDRPRPKDVSGLRKNLRERDGRLFWHWDPSFMEGGSGKNATRHQTPLDDMASRLTLPTLLIRGEHSKLIDEDSVEHFRTLVPHAETAEVGGAGHMVAGDANTPFTAAITDFLARHYPA